MPVGKKQDNKDFHSLSRRQDEGPEIRLTRD